MKRFFVFAFLFSVTNYSLFAATTELQFHFKNKKYQHLQITSFYGLTESIVSEKTDKAGIKKWKLKLPLTNGFYRLKSETGESIDFIYLGQKMIQLDISDKLTFMYCTSKDPLNQSYLEFQKFSRNTNVEFMKLNSRLSTSLTQDSISIYKGRKDSLMKNYKQTVLKISEENRNNLFGITAKLLLEPEYIPNDTISHFEFQKKHFFDKVDFSDPIILRSTILPNLFGKYFEKYVDYDESGFQFAIELILSKSSLHPLVSEFCLDYLIQLFSTAGPEVILDHIIEKYYTKYSCNEISLKSDIKGLLKLLPGNKIDFDSLFSQHLQNEEILKFKNSELTLIVFWSVHCDFCQKELKLISQLKENHSKLNVMSIHIDEDSLSETEFYRTENIGFIKISENKSWEGPLAKHFRVNKTPMVYLIDNSGTIITRNTNGEELMELIKNKLK